MRKASTSRIAVTWGLVVLWATFIFLMSAHTGSSFSNGEGIVGLIRRWLDSMQIAILGEGVDVVSPLAHFVEYLVLGLLMMLALEASGVERHVVLLAIGLCGVYAMTDELHQAFVPGRECDPMDWVVDVCGAFLGSWIAGRAFNAWGTKG